MSKIALAQVRPELGDKEANLNKMHDIISKTDASLIIFPEMFLTGYTIRDKTMALAETLEGESVKAISKMASDSGKAIIVGMPERDMDKQGILYNSALVALPDGSVSTTRKTYLVNFGPFEEETYFSSSGPVFPIYNTPVGKVAVIICFDIFFPELTKYYALQGVDMVVCISASPSATREFFEKMMVARAIENTIFFAYTNLVGTENNMVFWGGDALIGPRGGVLAKGPLYEEDVIEVELDLSELDVARQFRPTIKETRGDILSKLAKLYDLDDEDS